MVDAQRQAALAAKKKRIEELKARLKKKRLGEPKAQRNQQRAASGKTAQDTAKAKLVASSNLDDYIDSLLKVPSSTPVPFATSENVTAAVEIAKDIDYEVWVEKIDEITKKVDEIRKRMNEIGGSDVTHPDKEEENRLCEEYFQLEQEMKKYRSALYALKKLRLHMDGKPRIEAQFANVFHAMRQQTSKNGNGANENDAISEISLKQDELSDPLFDDMGITDNDEKLAFLNICRASQQELRRAAKKYYHPRTRQYLSNMDLEDIKIFVSLVIQMRLFDLLLPQDYNETKIEQYLKNITVEQGISQAILDVCQEDFKRCAEKLAETKYKMSACLKSDVEQQEELQAKYKVCLAELDASQQRWKEKFMRELAKKQINERSRMAQELAQELLADQLNKAYKRKHLLEERTNTRTCVEEKSKLICKMIKHLKFLSASFNQQGHISELEFSGRTIRQYQTRQDCVHFPRSILYLDQLEKVAIYNTKSIPLTELSFLPKLRTLAVGGILEELSGSILETPESVRFTTLTKLELRGPHSFPIIHRCGGLKHLVFYCSKRKDVDLALDLLKTCDSSVVQSIEKIEFRSQACDGRGKKKGLEIEKLESEMQRNSRFLSSKEITPADKEMLKHATTTTKSSFPNRTNDVNDEHLETLLFDVLPRCPNVKELVLKLVSFKAVANRIRKDDHQHWNLPKSLRRIEFFWHFMEVDFCDTPDVAGRDADAAKDILLFLDTFVTVDQLKYPFPVNKNSPEIQAVKHALIANLMGRRLWKGVGLKDNGTWDISLPMAVWPFVLQRANVYRYSFSHFVYNAESEATGIYQLLRKGPVILDRFPPIQQQQREHQVPFEVLFEEDWVWVDSNVFD